jgi:F-type H+-transporting ATPase subunit a
MADAHKHSPLDHVVDNSFLEVPLVGNYPLPKINLGFAEFQLTRFMVMEVLVAALIILIIVPLVRHVARRPVTKGAFLNAFEAILLFIRDGIARPAIGEHDADAFLPYLWTVFLFVLFCNLLGMIPGGASATGNINVTAVLAVMTFVVVVVAGSKKLGPAGFWVGLVPTLDVPKVMKAPLWVLMFLIEIAGLFIRHLVLSVRLFANMLAGHIVLAVILGFIIEVQGYAWYAVMPASVAGVVALSLLELFVAFLQAYIFTFLSALFIGSAVHPH